MVAPCNLNEKCFIKPLLKKLKEQNVRFKTVLADAQYNSSKIREAVKEASKHRKGFLAYFGLNLPQAFRSDIVVFDSEKYKNA